MKCIKEVLSGTIDLIENKYNNGNIVTGLDTGFNDLNKMTGGFHGGQLIIVGSRPLMGKSTFIRNITEHCSIPRQKYCLIFNLEESSNEMSAKMLSSLGKINLQYVKTGKLVEDDWERLTNAVGWLSKSKLIVDESKRLTITELCNIVKATKEEYPNLSLVVIDYLQLIFSNKISDNKTEELSSISRDLKILAMELNITILAASQLNRNLEQRYNKRPNMSDFRGSGTLEEDADIVIFIYRDEVYNEDSEMKGIAEIIIAKQRGGPIGTIRLTFSGKYSRFDNFIDLSV